MWVERGRDEVARVARRLTAKGVAAMSKPGRYCDGHRLWLQVRGPDNKSWLLRYTSPVTGKPRTMGLGDAFRVSLAEAREQADLANRTIRAGRDPLEEAAQAESAKKAARAGVTFKEASARYIKAHSSTWRNAKHRAQWGTTLSVYADPVIGEMPVHAIDTKHIIRILEELWHLKPETASRVRGRVESVLDFAATHGWRSAGENPARWRGHLQNVLPPRSKVAQVQHHAALRWKEMPQFVGTALAAEGSVAALALRFTIYTAARTGEVLGATWKEIDLNGKIWIVPADRMKGHRPHTVPLSNAAMDILRQAAELGQNPDGYIFSGQKKGRPLSGMALSALLRRLGQNNLTIHGFRSSFRDWCAEATDHPRDVAEMALAHAIGSKVEAAYRRGDLFEKRITLMEAWASFLIGDAS